MTPRAARFEDYRRALARVEPGPIPEIDPEILEVCENVTRRIEDLPRITQKPIVEIVSEEPDTVPVLAATVGLGRERLKTWLTEHFDTAGWVALARSNPGDLVARMDDELGLIKQLREQSSRTWTWADVLARVMAPQQRASRAIRAGRALEDAVEDVVGSLDLTYETRTRFRGARGESAPADVVVPSSDRALVAIAVKGFDSTGSKLTDARREIEEMVSVKTPRQYVFAVVDGLGWLRRESDLRRIYELGAREEIEGPYTQGDLGDLRGDLEDAARRVRLIE